MRNEIVSILEDEDALAAIFIDPNDGYASNKDSAVEDDEGLFFTEASSMHQLKLCSQMEVE